MNGLYIEFSAGRRGVNHPECKWCGAKIHDKHADDPLLDIRWLDGSLQEFCDVPIGQPARKHEPATEDGPRLGPFEHYYVQLTYDRLTHESETVAHFDHDRGDWIIAEPWTGAGEAYSDITIFMGFTIPARKEV